MFLLKLVQTLEAARVRFALCGGQALALHGAVRGTVDVDLVLRLDLMNLERAERALTHGLGLVSRIPIHAEDLVRFREEYIEKRNLKAWSFVHPLRASEVVDLLVTNDLSEYSVVHKEAWGQRIPIVSLDDLIEMKQASGRPQDLADIDALKRLRPKGARSGSSSKKSRKS